MRVICPECNFIEGMDMYEITHINLYDTIDFDAPMEFVRYELECPDCGELFIFETEDQLNDYLAGEVDNGFNSF